MTKPKKCKCGCGVELPPTWRSPFLNKDCKNLFDRSTPKRIELAEAKKQRQTKLTLAQKEKRFKQLKKQYGIKKISDKRIKENKEYLILRVDFLAKTENQVCPITKQQTTDIHHKKGRIGKLFLDTRYWIAVSRNGHRWIEENPIEAKKLGYSLNRLHD
jgi:hypothetical protein